MKNRKQILKERKEKGFCMCKECVDDVLQTEQALQNMKKDIDDKVKEFLDHSNKIEGVYDADSLQQAIYAWDFVVSFEKLTPSVILKAHKILTLHQLLRPDEKGYFRKRPVWIGGREGLDQSMIPSAIAQWCDVVNANVQAKIESAYKITHIAYERIHPFIDGNGRTGRIFMNWQRIKSGLPILVIKEDERYEYYKWFQSD